MAACGGGDGRVFIEPQRSINRRGFIRRDGNSASWRGDISK
jgi:hypothetical protein